MTTGIAIFAHGSSIESANDAVRAIASEFREKSGFALVEAAFLGPGQPELPAAVARLIEQGAKRVVIVPYFLTLGTHLQRDLPRIVAGIAEHHPGISIEVTPPLDGHPALVGILADRAAQALPLDDPAG